jgi:hypothetical protein
MDVRTNTIEQIVRQVLVRTVCFCLPAKCGMLAKRIDSRLGLVRANYALYRVRWKVVTKSVTKPWIWPHFGRK